MTLRVPLTLTIIPALTMSIGEPAFRDSPLCDRGDRSRQRRESSRSSILAVPASRRSAAGAFPRCSLAEILGLESNVERKDRTLIVLRPAGGDVYALSVDRIHDHEELVVKPAAPAVMATGLYAGTTLADDGSPILLFDPAGLAQVGGVKLEASGTRRPDRREQCRHRVKSDARAAVPWAGRRASRAPPGDRRPHRGSSGERHPQDGGPAARAARRRYSPARRVAGAELGRRRCASSALTTARTRSAMPSPKSSTSPRSTTT